MLNPETLLAELVATPSFSGKEQTLASLLTTHLTAAGLVVQKVEGNLVVDIVGQSGPILLFASHMDTVKAGPSWQTNPFAAVWQNERLVGLGANDAKASLVAMCCAAVAMAEKSFCGTLRVALVVEEETSNLGMQQVLAATSLPDMAVIGEPTALEVVRAQAGLGVLRARWLGRSCHAAHAAHVPHDNALLRACTEIAALPSCYVFADRHPLLGPTTLVPAVLQSGDRHNRVPDLAVATFDVRLTPPDTAFDLAAWLQGKLPSATVEISSDRLRAIETAADQPLVVAALVAAGRVAAIASNTMSDMALLQGIPAIKCGPGETSRSHTPDEFITRAELHAGVSFYTKLATSMLTCAEVLV